MEKEFYALFHGNVKLKSQQQELKRKKFDQKKDYIKIGLYLWPKFQPVREQNFFQKMLACETIKQKGNNFFKQQLYEQATMEYLSALSIFRYVVCRNGNWRKEGIIDECLDYIDEKGQGQDQQMQIRQIKINLYQNLAVTYLKQNQTQNSLDCCEEALSIDPKSIKAHYRKAKAIIHEPNTPLDKYKEAISILKSAQLIDPNDQLINQELKLINSKVQQLMEKKHEFRYNKIFQEDQQASPLKQMQQQQEENKKIDQQPIKVSDLAKQKQQSLQNSEFKMNPPIIAPKPTGDPLKTHKLDQIYIPEGNETYFYHQFKPNPSNDSSQDEKDDELVDFINNMTQFFKNLDDFGCKELNDFIQQQQKRQEQEKEQEQKIRQQNRNASEFWKMFNVQKDYENFDYDLSYEIDQSATIPDEIQELGKFIEVKGRDMVKLFELAGKKSEAEELKDKLKKAMSAKNQLEKIARLDFNKPKQKLKEIAGKYGIDINDDSIKQEFKKIQNQNLEDIRSWLQKNETQDQPKQINVNIVVNNSIQEPQFAQKRVKRNKNKDKKKDDEHKEISNAFEDSSAQKELNQSNWIPLQNGKDEQKTQITQNEQTQNVVINNNYYTQTFNMNNQVINNFYDDSQSNTFIPPQQQGQQNQNSYQQRPPSPPQQNQQQQYQFANQTFSQPQQQPLAQQIPQSMQTVSPEQIVQQVEQQMTNFNLQQQDNNDQSKTSLDWINIIILIISICLFLATFIWNVFLGVNSSDGEKKILSE